MGFAGDHASAASATDQTRPKVNACLRKRLRHSSAWQAQSNITFVTSGSCWIFWV
jgi:hypothetical protein